jgi:hypothetical protein
VVTPDQLSRRTRISHSASTREPRYRRDAGVSEWAIGIQFAPRRA